MTITLFKDNGCWMASHDGPGSDDIRHLFGTNVLPTPFMAEMEEGRVYAAISKLNPACTVMLGETAK